MCRIIVFLRQDDTHGAFSYGIHVEFCGISVLHTKFVLTFQKC